MTSLIYKYEFVMEQENFSLELPRNAKVLAVQVQNGKPVLWAKFKAGNQHVTSKRNFFIATTGNMFEDHGKTYIGTIQMNWFVAHIYEVEE